MLTGGIIILLTYNSRFTVRPPLFLSNTALASNKDSFLPQSYQCFTLKELNSTPFLIMHSKASVKLYSPCDLILSVTNCWKHSNKIVDSLILYNPTKALLLFGIAGFSTACNTFPSSSNSTTPNCLGSSTFLIPSILVGLAITSLKSNSQMVSPNAIKTSSSPTISLVN